MCRLHISGVPGGTTRTAWQESEKRSETSDAILGAGWWGLLFFFW